MTDFITCIENCLHDYAQPFTPEGSQPEAVIHQWMHAIAYGTDIFAQYSGACKDTIIDILSNHGLYSTPLGFKRKIRQHTNIKPSSSPQFTFIDLFAGIGGMRLGFQAHGGQCVFSSEFEKNAQKTYKANHGELPLGDITEIKPQDIPDHDILVGGFPCQPFSHAGLKLGIEDTRGTLFHDIAAILKTKKPKFALLENVKGLVSHDKGYTLQVILKTLTGIGYSCNISKELIANGSTKEIQTAAKKMVLRSVDYGVPQNRQRIYIVLWRDDISLESFSYPAPTGIETRVGNILEKHVDSKYTISDRLWEGHQRRKKQNKIDGKGFGYGLVTEENPYTNTISARYYKDGSEILIQQEGGNPRKITPREAARLQGFPDEFLVNKSDVQVYKQFGNSVSIPVIKELAKEINRTGVLKQ